MLAVGSEHSHIDMFSTTNGTLLASLEGHSNRLGQSIHYYTNLVVPIVVYCDLNAIEQSIIVMIIAYALCMRAGWIHRGVLPTCYMHRFATLKTKLALKCMRVYMYWFGLEIIILSCTLLSPGGKYVAHSVLNNGL